VVAHKAGEGVYGVELPQLQGSPGTAARAVVATPNKRASVTAKPPNSAMPFASLPALETTLFIMSCYPFLLEAGVSLPACCITLE
jgi:hypothetical protein